MKYKYTYRLIIIMLLAVSTAFAVINYNGNDHNEALLPLSQTGTGTFYDVVMGSNLVLTVPGKNQINTFTINGTSYVNKTNFSVPASSDGRYFIVFSGKRTDASYTLTGTNDWTTQTYTNQIAPFSLSGSGSYFYSFTGAIDSIVTNNVDFFLINNVEYTNQTLTTMPEKMGDTYYMYYGAVSSSGSLQVKDYTPKLNVKVFIEGGL